MFGPSGPESFDDPASSAENSGDYPHFADWLRGLDRDTPEPAAGIIRLHNLDKNTLEPESIEFAESTHASGAPRPEEQHSGLAQSEISAFLKDTFESFAEFL